MSKLGLSSESEVDTSESESGSEWLMSNEETSITEDDSSVHSSALSQEEAEDEVATDEATTEPYQRYIISNILLYSRLPLFCYFSDESGVEGSALPLHKHSGTPVPRVKNAFPDEPPSLRRRHKSNGIKGTTKRRSSLVGAKRQLQPSANKNAALPLALATRGSWLTKKRKMMPIQHRKPKRKYMKAICTNCKTHSLILMQRNSNGVYIEASVDADSSDAK